MFVPVLTFVQNGKWEVYILGSDGKPVSRESWKVIYADSEETEKGNYTADKVFDLQESTYWKTVDKISYPHQIVIDLSEKLKITGFRYLPRAEKGAPGQIRKYKIYISDGFKL